MGGLSTKLTMPEMIIKAHGMKMSQKKKCDDENLFEPPGGCNLNFKKQLFGLCYAF
jgi:hypothetical protein